MDEGKRKEALARVDASRHRTPLFLYCLAVLFLISWIPGVDSIFGEAGWSKLSRIAVGFLFIYVAALIQERQRMGRMFREVLEAFRTFGGRVPGGRDVAAQREAVTFLIASLKGADDEVRGKVHSQLRRLTGQDLPPDHAAWSQWWAQAEAEFSGPSAQASGRESE